MQQCVQCAKPALFARADRSSGGDELFCSVECGSAHFAPLGLECRSLGNDSTSSPLLSVSNACDVDSAVLAVLAHADCACLLQRPIAAYRHDDDTYMLPAHLVLPLRQHYAQPQHIAGKRDAKAAELAKGPPRTRQVHEFATLERLPIDALALILENLDLQTLLRALRTSRTLASLAMMRPVFARALKSATLRQLSEGMGMLARTQLRVQYNSDLVLDLARAWHAEVFKPGQEVTAILSFGPCALAEFVLYTVPPAYTGLTPVLDDSDARHATLVALYEHLVSPMFEAILDMQSMALDLFVTKAIALGTQATKEASRQYRLLVHFVRTLAFLQRPHPLLEADPARLQLLWEQGWDRLVLRLKKLPDGYEVLRLCASQSGLLAATADARAVVSHSAVRAASALGQRVLFAWVDPFVQRDNVPASVSNTDRLDTAEKRVLVELQVLVPLARQLCRSLRLEWEDAIARFIVWRITDNNPGAVLSYLVQALDVLGESTAMLLPLLEDILTEHIREGVPMFADAMNSLVDNEHWNALFAPLPLASLRASLENLVFRWDDYLSTQLEIFGNRGDDLTEQSEQFHASYDALLATQRLGEAAKGLGQPLKADYYDAALKGDNDSSSSAPASP